MDTGFPAIANLAGKIEGMPYLIDGHNLIPKLGLSLDSPDDEMDLVFILQEFARLSGRAIEVYFDGAPAGESGKRRFGSVTAHFVRLGTTADSAIRARIRSLEGAAHNWIVVSSDHEIQDAARADRVDVISSDQFASKLKKLIRSGAGANSIEDRKLSAAEVEDWLKLFEKRGHKR